MSLGLRALWMLSVLWGASFLPLAMSQCDEDSVRFTNCERNRCASVPHANQSFTCEGCLKIVPPSVATLSLSCGQLGTVRVLISTLHNDSISRGKLTLRNYSRKKNRFVATAIIADVLPENSGINCTLACDNEPDDQQKRLFPLCVAKENDTLKKTVISVALSIGLFVFFAIVVPLVFTFQYELLFWWRRLKHTCSKEELTDASLSQIVILHSSYEKQNAEALVSDLQRSFNDVTCRLYLEGLAGQEVGDNAQTVIRSSSIAIVLMDRKCFEEESFTHGLALTFEFSRLKRVYIWRTDIKINFIKNVNDTLAANLKTDRNRKRCVSWSRDSAIPTRELLARLRLILPLQAILPSS